VIVGVFRNSFPRVVLRLQGLQADIDVEFIVDTGFEGDLSLPISLVRQVDCAPWFDEDRLLADGSMLRCPAYTFEMSWNGEPRETQILRMDGHPLLGGALLDGCRMEMEFVEGAEVVIEFP
jgi:clan AA aspartic protease